MKRWVPSLLLLSLMLAFTAPLSWAQEERKVEFALGGSYPLLAERFRVSQNLAYRARLEFRINDWWMLGPIYEVQNTTDKKNIFDVDVVHYGLTNTFVISGEPEFTILGMAAIGQGSVTSSNEALAASTDISLWYEAGVGARWTIGQRMAFRFQLTFRNTVPDVASPLISGSRFSMVPAFDFSMRF